MRDLIKMVERKKASGDDFEIKINDKSLYKIIYGEYNVELNEALKSFEKERLNDDFNISIINFNTSIDLPKEINDLKNLEILEDNIKLRIYKNSKEKFINAEFINNYPDIDERNIQFIRYEKSPKNNLFKICGYYNQFGDIILNNKMSYYPAKINIAICGPAGSGKSTLINTLLGKKRCLEGQGGSITNFVSQYTSLDYPINFIDFPGFGDKDYANQLISIIRKKNLQLKNSQEAIHIVLYCIKFHQRTFLNNESDVIEELMSLNDVKIIFVITRSEAPDQRSFIRFRKTIENEINNIIIKKKIKAEIVKKVLGDDITKSIIPVYCRTEKVNGNFVKTFGIDVLFDLIYDFLSPYIIDIKKLKEENDIQNIIQSHFFLKIFKSKEELINSANNKIYLEVCLFWSKLVIYYPKLIYSKIEDTRELLEILFLEFYYNISLIFLNKFDITEALLFFKNKVLPTFQNIEKDFKFRDDEDEKSCRKMFKILRFVFPILSPLYLLNFIFLPFVCKFLQKNILEKFFEEGEVNQKIYLIKVAEGLNMGINGLKEISNKFKNNN